MKRTIVGQALYDGLVGLHLAGWVAQIPGYQIHFRIDVAGGAGHRPIAREFGIVKESSSLANRDRRRIKTSDRDFLEHRAADRIETERRRLRQRIVLGG